MTIVIIAADRHERIVWASRSLGDVFGWQPHEVVGTAVALLMPDRYRGDHVANFARVAETGESELVGVTRDLFGLTRDGTEFPLRITVGVFGAPPDVLFVATIEV